VSRDAILRAFLLLAFAAVVVMFGWRSVQKRRRERADAQECEEQLASLTGKYNAVADWQNALEEGWVKVGGGYRSAYTCDITDAVLREDGRPLLVVGYVFDVTTEATGATLNVLSALGCPDMYFVLDCTTQHTDVVLNQPTDDGDFFAVVATVTSVSRPGFEADAWVETEDDETYADIVVQPGNTYVLRGRCLGITYIGDYESD